MAKMTVAIVQDTPVFLNKKETTAKTSALIEKAAKEGAQLVAFPETWLPGYPVWLDFAPEAALWDHPPANRLFRVLFENSVASDGAEIRKICSTSRKHKCAAVVGIHERDGGTLYNSMVFIDPNGDVAGLHRKLMPTYSERMIWGRGDGSTLVTMETALGNVGGLICWEHWMPLARAAMHAKQEAIHVAQWPMVKEMNLVASRHYAFEGNCYVLAAGTVLQKQDIVDAKTSEWGEAEELLMSMPGEMDTYIHRGGSTIIGPNGDILVGPSVDQREILLTELDINKITESQLRLDTSGHYSRPDVFQLRVNASAQTNVQYDEDYKNSHDRNVKSVE